MITKKYSLFLLFCLGMFLAVNISLAEENVAVSSGAASGTDTTAPEISDVSAVTPASSGTATAKEKKVKKSKKKTDAKDTKKVNETIVTFVELGSVRCIPCKKMQPIMKEIEEKYGEKGVKVVFYDVWTEAGAPYAKQYKIMAIPTQVFLDKDGKEYFRHMGFFPKDELIKILEKGGIK